MNGCMSNSFRSLITNPRFAFFLAGLWMVFLYVMSSLPQVGQYNTIYGLDKVEHIIAFGVLGVLLTRGFQPMFPKKGLAVVFLVTVIIAVYGALDEFHQMFVPGRTASLTDLLADVVGGFSASFVLYYLSIRSSHCGK